MRSGLGPISGGGNLGVPICRYLCGAIRLKNAKKCVVYSIGSRGEFSFEELMHDVNPNCEIHVFDPAPEFANSSSTPAFIRSVVGSGPLVKL